MNADDVKLPPPPIHWDLLANAPGPDKAPEPVPPVKKGERSL